MRMMQATALAMALGCAATGPAVAQPAPGVAVTQPWSRATAASAQSGGVFLSLQAQGTPDRLTGVSTPRAAKAELHETVNQGGVMKMLEVPTLALEPGRPVELKPGSYHIMLTGLKQPLRRGETFPVTLTFANAPPVTVDVAVQSAGASGPGAAAPAAGAAPAMDHGTTGHGMTGHGTMNHGTMNHGTPAR